MTVKVLVGGYVYTLRPGERDKLVAYTQDGELRNDWLEVEPEQDWLGAPLPGQRVQLAHVVSWVTAPDEPAGDGD